MKTLRFAVGCSLGLVALATPARAQAPFVNMIDHIHPAAPDQAKGAEWYRAHFGAEPTPEGPDRMMLGTTRLISQKTEVPKPSEESVLNLIGLSVACLDPTMKKLRADGVKVVL